MDPPTILPPDLSSLLARFSNEELHQIGMALIQQAHHPNQTQKNIHYQETLEQSPRQRSQHGRPTNENNPSLPSLMNQQSRVPILRPRMDQDNPPVSSTPKHPANESFDNVSGRQRHTAKRIRNSDRSPTTASSQQQNHQTPMPPHSQAHPFNLGVLKRAVSNNLPGFFLSFDPSVDQRSIPSSTQVAIMLKKVFAEHKAPVKELSMCMQAGERRFKFAVGDKEAFLYLFNLEWPGVLEGMPVSITKPRSLPDCYALVVRYIPRDVNEETAKREIMKAIPAAISFSAIQYHHRQRASYDLRFNVPNLEQYQTALELSRIAIGQHYLPLTKFLPGYRLTYCTACWKIGHMRDKCQSPVCCRRCLQPFVTGVKHDCPATAFSCAQCGGDHFSLDAKCHVVKKYRDELKTAVDSALAAGAIKRPPPGALSRPFQTTDNDFPALTLAKDHPKRSERTAWCNIHDATTTADVPQHTSLQKEMKEMTEAIKMLAETTARLDRNLGDISKRLEKQDARIASHKTSLNTTVDAVILIAKWVQGTNNEKSKLKVMINKTLEELEKGRRNADAHSDNERADAIPPPPPAATNDTANNNNNREVFSNAEMSLSGVDQDA